MKIKLLPMAVGIILATQFGVAHAAEVQVYGKVNTSVNANDNQYLGKDQKDNQQLNSNASRVGVKGDININDDLKAVYKLEYTVYVDDGSSNDLSETGSDSNTFQARNNYGGLNSKTYGQLVAGKNDTPFKLIQNSDLDRFNDLDQGDMQNYLVGENRVNNMLLYTSPLLSGFTINAQAYSDEETGEDTGISCPAKSVYPQTAGQACGNAGSSAFGDHWSTSITYDIGKFYAGLAYNNNVTNTDAVRLMSSYKITDNFMIAGLIQSAETHEKDYNQDGVDEGFGDGMTLSSGSLNTALNPAGTTNDFNTAIHEQDAYMGNIMWTIVPEKWVVYAQMGYSESTLFDSSAMVITTGTCPGITCVVNDYKDAQFDTTFWGLGVDRILSKKVKLFAYYTDEKVDISDNAAVESKLIDDGKFKTAGVGLEIKF